MRSLLGILASVFILVAGCVSDESKESAPVGTAAEISGSDMAPTVAEPVENDTAQPASRGIVDADPGNETVPDLPVVESFYLNGTVTGLLYAVGTGGINEHILDVFVESAATRIVVTLDWIGDTNNFSAFMVAPETCRSSQIPDPAPKWDCSAKQKWLGGATGDGFFFGPRTNGTASVLEIDAEQIKEWNACGDRCRWGAAPYFRVAVNAEYRYRVDVHYENGRPTVS